MKVDTQSKVMGEAELHKLVEKWRRLGECIVFTNGVFDILHRGHLESLERAAAFGEHLIIGLNSDASARSLGKGPDRPMNKQEDRARLVAGLAVVDVVVIFEEPTPRELIRKIKPDVLVKGADWAEDHIEGREFAGRVERIPLVEGYSTSTLIEKIRG